jgi:chromosome segregation ATPase
MKPEGISDQQYISILENKVDELTVKMGAMLDEDSVKGMYYTLNAKLAELNKAVNDYKIKIDESDSKAYERFWKTFIDIKEVAGNVLWLKTQIFGDNGKQVIRNPMEAFATSKKEKNASETT